MDILGKVVSIFGSIVAVALAFTLVTHTETANIIKAFGGAFAGGIGAAVGH